MYLPRVFQNTEVEPSVVRAFDYRLASLGCGPIRISKESCLSLFRIQDLDMLHKNDSDDNQDKIETLQSSLQDEVQKRQTAEEDMKRYIQVNIFSIYMTRKTVSSHRLIFIVEVILAQKQVSLIGKYDWPLGAQVFNPSFNR